MTDPAVTPDEPGRAETLHDAARHLHELADRADRECVALYGEAKWFLPFPHDGDKDVEGAMEDLMATFSPTLARALADLLDVHARYARLGYYDAQSDTLTASLAIAQHLSEPTP